MDIKYTGHIADQSFKTFTKFGIYFQEVVSKVRAVTESKIYIGICFAIAVAYFDFSRNEYKLIMMIFMLFFDKV